MKIIVSPLFTLIHSDRFETNRCTIKVVKMTVADETNSKTGTVKAITMMEMTDSLPSSDVTITQASSSVSVKSHCGSYFDSYIEEHNFGGSCCKLLCVCA